VKPEKMNMFSGQMLMKKPDWNNTPAQFV